METYSSGSLITSSSANNVVGYSCFVDSKTRYMKQAVRFLYSLVRIGVDIDNIHFSICEDVDEKYIQLLKHNCGLKNIEKYKKFTHVSKPANKWLQLCNPNLVQYSHIIVNDSDKVYINFDENWADGSVRACKFVPRPTFTVFENIFRLFELGSPRFHLEKPDPRDESKDPRNYVNNHNGGLIIIPGHLLDPLKNTWKKYIDLLHDNSSVLGENIRNLDQVAFALAMEELRHDINFLPKSLDIGMGVRNLSPWLTSVQSNQLIFHIHQDEDANGIILPREGSDKAIRDLSDSFNHDYIEWLHATDVFEYIFPSDNIEQTEKISAG